MERSVEEMKESKDQNKEESKVEELSTEEKEAMKLEKE